MSDTVEVIDKDPDEAVPPELPASAHAPAQSDDLDSLLREFDEKTGQSGSDTLSSDQNATPDFDQQIQQLFGSDPKVAELQTQVDSFRAVEHQRAELAEFNSYADALQKQLPSFAPPDYAATKMMALAHDPEIRLAWETRHIDPKAASVDLAHVQHALNQLKGKPNADPKQVAELNKLVYQLNVAAHSRSILRQVNLNILKEARSLQPRIDDEATQMREEVIAAVRGASTPFIPEPKVEWGKLSGKEFREKVLRDHGFDPGGW